MLHCRTAAVIAPHGSENGRGEPGSLMRWTWNQAPGGLPVDFHAAVAGTPLLLLTSVVLSKPLLRAVAPPPVTTTSSMIAAPRVRELKPPAAALVPSAGALPWFSSSKPRLVL